MQLRGSLANVDIQEILEWLHSASRTGALDLENANFRKAVYFVEGSIVAISSNEPADSVAHWLNRRGLLTSDQVDAALRIQLRTGRALVDVLHKTGAVGDAELEDVIQLQAMEAIWGVFLWEEGRFNFREGDMPEDLPAAVSLEVIETLGEGVRRREAAKGLRARVPARSSFVRTVDPAEDAMLAPFERSVLEHLGAPLALVPLMVELPAGEFALIEVLALLVERQAIAVVTGAGGDEAVEAQERAAGRILREVGMKSTGAVAGGVPEAATNEMGFSAVGLMPASTAPAVPATAHELLSRARRQMELRHYELALYLFRQAERADPSDPRLATLRAGAESVFCEVLYRSELLPEARPRRTVPTDSIGSEFGLVARSLLRRMDGRSTVRDLVVASGAHEIEALVAMRDLKRRGFVETAAS